MAKRQPSDENRPPAESDDESGMPRDAQLVADVLDHLHDHPRPWWDPGYLRERWPTAARLGWLEDRPDVRGRITHEITGLGLPIAREADPAFQADLVERALKSGLISAERWQRAFPNADLARHGPTGVIWQLFRLRFPWDSRDAADRSILRWLLSELLRPRPWAGHPDTPLLSPLYLRSAIDVRAWQDSIPLDLRVQVDACRLRHELEGEPFTCRDELEIVTVEKVVDLVPTDQLQSVLDALERVLPGLAEQELDPGDLGDASEDEVENTESLRATS